MVVVLSERNRKGYPSGVIERDITDTVLQRHLAEISRDSIDLFLLGDAAGEAMLRLACIHGTSLVNHARISHSLGTPEALVLGEALLATALGGTNLKESETFSCLLESDGPLGGFVTEVNMAGHLRGYLKVSGEPEAYEASTDPVDLLGTGWLDVVRSNQERSHVSRGHVEWLPGSVAWNLERYFATSEQTATSIHISTHCDGDGRILGAAALLMQRMPGGSDEGFRAAREMMPAPAEPAKRLSLGETAPEIVRELFREYRPRLVSARNTEFFCPCSRERFARFLSALPAEEARDILENGPIPLVTTCYNCSSEYSFTERDLREIFGVSGQGNTFTS